MRYSYKFILTLALMVPGQLSAASVVTSGKITKVWNEWGANSMAVTTTAPVVGNGCVHTSNYVTDPTNANNQMIQPMLLSAYMAGKNISLVIDGCRGNDSIIISVMIE